MLLRNVLQMQSTRRDLRGQVLMSLSLHRQDGTSDPVFGDLTRVRAVLGEIEESPEFIALMARVNAHASNRAKAHGDTLRQTAAALIKFGTSNGVHPDDIDALKVHVG